MLSVYFSAPGKSTKAAENPATPTCLRQRPGGDSAPSKTPTPALISPSLKVFATDAAFKDVTNIQKGSSMNQSADSDTEHFSGPERIRRDSSLESDGKESRTVGTERRGSSGAAGEKQKSIMDSLGELPSVCKPGYILGLLNILLPSWIRIQSGFGFTALDTGNKRIIYGGGGGCSTNLSPPPTTQQIDNGNPAKNYFVLVPVLGIRDILVRIRIRGSMPLTNGSGFNSGADSFLQ